MRKVLIILLVEVEYRLRHVAVVGVVKEYSLFVSCLGSRFL